MSRTLLPDGINRSAVIAVGGVAQTVAIRNEGRSLLSFQNTSSSPMRLTEDGSTASATNGFLLNAGDIVRVETRQLVSVFCATTGATFQSTEA